MNTNEGKFQSFDHARRILMRLVLSASHFMRSVAEPLKYVQFDSCEDNAAKCSYVLRQQNIYIHKLRQWRASFETYLSSLSPAEQNLDRAKGPMCIISYSYTTIALDVCLSPDETEYDKHIQLFIDIVQKSGDRLSSSVSVSQTAETEKQCDRAFDLEVSIIHPLYFTALKCRVSNIRRRAITLLYGAGKEGVWDGVLMARIAEHVVGIEENKARPSADGTKAEISEQNRVCGVAIRPSREESNSWVERSMRRWPRYSPNGANLPGVERDAGYVWEFHEDIVRW
jgi:hypothetical protein